MNTKIDNNKDGVDKFSAWVDAHPFRYMFAAGLLAVIICIPIVLVHSHFEKQAELTRLEIENDIMSGYKVSLDGVYMDSVAIEDLDTFLDNTVYLGADDANACLKFKHTDKSK